jgi:hypothetical protein
MSGELQISMSWEQFLDRLYNENRRLWEDALDCVNDSVAKEHQMILNGERADCEHDETGYRVNLMSDTDKE